MSCSSNDVLAKTAYHELPALTRHSVIVLGSCRLFREGLVRILQPSCFGMIAEASTINDALLQVKNGEQVDLLLCSLEPGQDIHVHLGAIRTARQSHPESKSVLLIPSCTGEDLVAAMLCGVNGIVFREISGEMLTRALDLVMHGSQVLPPGLAAQVLANLQPGGAGVRTLVPEPSAATPEPHAVRPVMASNPAQLDAGTNRKLAFATPRTNGTPWSERAAQPEGPRGHGLSDRETQILECLVEGASNKLIARQLDIAEATVKVHIKGLLRKINASNRTQAAIWALNNCLGLRPTNVDALSAPVTLTVANDAADVALFALQTAEVPRASLA